MKNYRSSVFLATFIISSIIGTSSCTNNKTEDAKEVAEDKNEQKFNNNNNEKDDQFLVEAAEINREEISLGQLAQQKGTSSHVKELGKMLEDAHTKSMNDLTAMAKTKNISLPTAQTDNVKDAYNKLNGKSGNDFGKEYSSMMVNGHKKAIELFEKAAMDCTDLDIKAWARETLPSLRTHLDQAIICQKECEKM
jgi:putative membrane protein